MLVKTVLMTLPPLIRYWQEAQTLCRVVSQRLADAQSQSESLEIKYSKAKRLVREYQSRYLLNPSQNSIKSGKKITESILNAVKGLKIMWMCESTSFPLKVWIKRFKYVLGFFREEERVKREAELRREIEERDKEHRETVERLQIQVRRHFSQSCLDVLQWTCHFSIVTVSHYSWQLARFERNEPEPESKNHPVDTPVTGKQLCYCKGYCCMALCLSLNMCCRRPVKSIPNYIL